MNYFSWWDVRERFLFKPMDHLGPKNASDGVGGVDFTSFKFS